MFDSTENSSDRKRDILHIICLYSSCYYIVFFIVVEQNMNK